MGIPDYHARSRANTRRLREEDQRRLAERDAFVETLLEPGEAFVARSGSHPLVSDRRIFVTRRLQLEPRTGEWVCDALAFAEITRWCSGRQHDGRPLLRLDHPPHQRIQRVPAHRLLSFQWGNAERPVTQTTTTFAFGKRTDPVLVAMHQGLRRAEVPQGPAFEIRPEGSREERMRGSSYTLRRYRSSSR